MHAADLAPAPYPTRETRETIILTPEGQEAFAEALLNPPPPSAGLQKAVQRYQELMSR